VKRGILLTAAALTAATIGAWTPATAQAQEPPGAQAQAPAQAEPVPTLDAYTATVTPEQAAALSEQGVDVVAAQPTADGEALQVDAVASAADRDRIAERTGVDLRLERNEQGQTARQAATAQAQAGYTVWRSWDEPGGIRDEIDQIARDNRNLVKKVVLGTTYQGRQIVALKVTQDARRVSDGAFCTIVCTCWAVSTKPVSGSSTAAPKTTPITRPLVSTSGPPELPERTSARTV